MDKVFSKKSILFGFLLVAFIIVFEIILAHLGLRAWPAFMVMIFFFVAHEDVSLAPDILIGGLSGIVCIILSKDFIHLVGPSIGTEAAKLAFVSSYMPSCFSRMPYLTSSTAMPSCFFSSPPSPLKNPARAH
jgi:hypothetical protein